MRKLGGLFSQIPLPLFILLSFVRLSAITFSDFFGTNPTLVIDGLLKKLIRVRKSLKLWVKLLVEIDPDHSIFNMASKKFMNKTLSERDIIPFLPKNICMTLLLI